MVVRVCPGVRSVQVDGCTVVYIPDGAHFIELNESATELWEALERGGWEPTSAVDYLESVYGTTTEEAHAFVDSFLADLERASAISRSG